MQRPFISMTSFCYSWIQWWVQLTFNNFVLLIILMSLLTSATEVTRNSVVFWAPIWAKWFLTWTREGRRSKNMLIKNLFGRIYYNIIHFWGPFTTLEAVIRSIIWNWYPKTFWHILVLSNIEPIWYQRKSRNIYESKDDIKRRQM